MQDHHAQARDEKVIVGVTRDPVLRPVGTVMVVVGMIWALFWGMAADAGTFGQPLAAAGLVFLGVVAAGIGRPEVQI